MNHSTTISVTSHRRTDRAGFTLLELMLTLGIVLATAAIAIPFSYREFIKRESVVARDRLLMQASQARAAARRDGVPYRMMVDVSGREVRVVVVDSRNPGLINSQGLSLDTDAQGQNLLAESWQYTRLPDEMRIAARPEEFDFDENDFASDDASIFEDSESDYQSNAWDQPAHLATFMPDGTVLSGEEAILEGDSQYRLVCNRWTGAIRLERVLDDDEVVQQVSERVQ